MKFSQLKKHVPHGPTLNIAYCVTGFIRRGADFTCVSMYFKIMSKVVKYTCRLRRYNHTHDQLNTRHFNIIFQEFFEGGGGRKTYLCPGGHAVTGLATPLHIDMWSLYHYNYI